MSKKIVNNDVVEPQYISLDAAILKAVKAGKQAPIEIYAEVADAVKETGLNNPDRVVDNRLQVLFHRGEIHHDGIKGGWQMGPEPQAEAPSEPK